MYTIKITDKYRSSWTVGSTLPSPVLCTILLNCKRIVAIAKLQFYHPGWWEHKLFLGYCDPQGFFLLTLQTDFSKPLGCHVLIHTQLKTGRDLLQISRAPSLCCCLLSCLLSCPVLSSALASLDCPFYLPNSGSLLSFLKVFVHFWDAI